MRTEVTSLTVAYLVDRFKACATFEDVKQLGLRVKADCERGYEWTLDGAAVEEIRGAWMDAKRRIESERADDGQVDHGAGVVHRVEGVSEKGVA